MKIDISVIVPIYNEFNYIKLLLEDILNNDLKLNNKNLNIEYLLIDGGSNDGTLDTISQYILQDKRIKLINNPMKFQVHALNIAIKKAKGDIIIRCDAHSRYPKYYFKRLYAYLIDNKEVGNVGFKSITLKGNNTLEAKVVAYILSNKFGVGKSHRNINSDEPVEVDTLLFGAWKKETFNEIGLFDENFIRGQDYEHNYRIKKSNKKVIIIPNGEFQYLTRTSIFKMFKMIFQYAHAKTHMLKKYHEIPTLRSFVPVILWFFIIASFLNKVFLFPVLIYIIIVLFVSITLSREDNFKSLFLYIYGFIGIHFSYFIGILKGIYDYFIINKNNVKFKETRNI